MEKAHRTAFIYPIFVAVWIATPFMGDCVPMWGQWLYWSVLTAVSVLGFVLAVRDKRSLLGIFSALTLLAWPITLAVALSSGPPRLRIADNPGPTNYWDAPTKKARADGGAGRRDVDKL